MTEPALEWPVALGAEIVSDLESAIRREWLVTNGLGGYAFGTVAGIGTRSYHGLLVAALDPPVGRTVLVAGLAEWATVAGHRVALHAHEYADGTIDQTGYRRLLAFRLESLLSHARAERGSPFLRALVVAADQFLVARRIPIDGEGDVEQGRTIIAGYPWFNDWGRDTMIALPGLCVATGRHDEAATILRSFARFVRDGLLPNDFPDRAGAVPEYNTMDASLWFPLAVRAHAIASGSESLVDELLPVL